MLIFIVAVFSFVKCRLFTVFVWLTFESLIGSLKHFIRLGITIQTAINKKVFAIEMFAIIIKGIYLQNTDSHKQCALKPLYIHCHGFLYLFKTFWPRYCSVILSLEQSRIEFTIVVIVFKSLFLSCSHINATNVYILKNNLL